MNYTEPLMDVTRSPPSNREDYLQPLKFMLKPNAEILSKGHFGVIKDK